MNDKNLLFPVKTILIIALCQVKNYILHIVGEIGLTKRHEKGKIKNIDC